MWVKEADTDVFVPFNRGGKVYFGTFADTDTERNNYKVDLSKVIDWYAEVTHYVFQLTSASEAMTAVATCSYDNSTGILAFIPPLNSNSAYPRQFAGNYMVAVINE